MLQGLVLLSLYAQLSTFLEFGHLSVLLNMQLKDASQSVQNLRWQTFCKLIRPLTRNKHLQLLLDVVLGLHHLVGLRADVPAQVGCNQVNNNHDRHKHVACGHQVVCKSRECMYKEARAGRCSW